MKTTYLHTKFGAFVVKEDGNMVTTTLLDPSSSDYADYLSWLAENNIPDPTSDSDQVLTTE